MDEETGPIEKREEEGEAKATFARAADIGARGIAAPRQFRGRGRGVLALSVTGESVWVVLKGLEAGAKAPPQPVEVQVGDIPVGGTKNIVYGSDPAIVMRWEDEIVVMSLVCTHLGCIVKWKPDDETFYCPCHAGTFERTGRVTGGPPPAPLERFAFTQKGDKIIVGARARGRDGRDGPG